MDLRSRTEGMFNQLETTGSLGEGAARKPLDGDEAFVMSMMPGAVDLYLSIDQRPGVDLDDREGFVRVDRAVFHALLVPGAASDGTGPADDSVGEYAGTVTSDHGEKRFVITSNGVENEIEYCVIAPDRQLFLHVTDLGASFEARAVARGAGGEYVETLRGAWDAP